MADGGIKRWFMLQLWRLQQVAQLLTLAMLAITLSLNLFGFIRWREPFSNPYLTIPLLIIVLALIIWAFAIVWDLRLKMWKEQATVLVEKNPYSREKMYSKEIAVYWLFWLPLLENMAKDDPKYKPHAKALRTWLSKVYKMDSNTYEDLKEILDFVGMDKNSLEELDKPN